MSKILNRAEKYKRSVLNEKLSSVISAIRREIVQIQGKKLKRILIMKKNKQQIIKSEKRKISKRSDLNKQKEGGENGEYLKRKQPIESEKLSKQLRRGRCASNYVDEEGAAGYVLVAPLDDEHVLAAFAERVMYLIEPIAHVLHDDLFAGHVGPEDAHEEHVVARGWIRGVHVESGRPAREGLLQAESAAGDRVRTRHLPHRAQTGQRARRLTRRELLQRSLHHEARLFHLRRLASRRLGRPCNCEKLSSSIYTNKFINGILYS